MTGITSVPDDSGARVGQRLESWKEIAAYMKRGVRTVRRWEKDEGLPIRRHLHKARGTVYADTLELDAWLKSRDSGGRASDSAVPVQPTTEPHRVMVAVLPFEGLGGDADGGYFGDGLTEDVITELGRLHPAALGVIARTTAMSYRGSRRTVRQIGAELHVDFVLEGRVRQEADQVRVTAQLISVSDQSHVWADSYERPVRGILALQREIASRIGHAVRLRLRPRPHAGLEGARDVEPEAYYACLKGRHLLNDFTTESATLGVEYLREAVRIDPTYAAAWAALAEGYDILGVWTDVHSTTTFQPAMDAAQQALRLDPFLADAYASLGLIHANHLWDWPAAERHYRRALELNPSCTPASQWYGELLAQLGRLDEALAVVDRATRNDPLSRAMPATRAFVLWLGRRFDEAIAAAEEVLKTDPRYAMALIRLGVAQAAKGAYPEAAEALLSAAEATPGLLDCKSLLGYVYARGGRTREALALLDELHDQATRRYVPAFLFANVHLGLGNKDEALRFIEQEHDARGWYLLLINRSPLYDELRSHPRFQALLRRMKFTG